MDRKIPVRIFGGKVREGKVRYHSWAMANLDDEAKEIDFSCENGVASCLTFHA